MADTVSTLPVRLDKWLWAARFFKTRRLSVDAVNSGRVEVNQHRVKPARIVQPGDFLEIRKPPFRYQLKILDLSNRRLSPALAQTLYEETEDSRAERQRVRQQMQSQPTIERRLIDGKPSKRDRRHLRKMRQGD